MRVVIHNGQTFDEWSKEAREAALAARRNKSAHNKFHTGSHKNAEAFLKANNNRHTEEWNKKKGSWETVHPDTPRKGPRIHQEWNKSEGRWITIKEEH